VRAWPGCHGVRLRSQAELGLGRSTGEPLAEAEVVLAPIEGIDPLETTRTGTSGSWSAALGGARLLVQAPGRGVLTVDGEVRLAMAGNHIQVAPPLEGVQAQLLASFALPFILAHQRGADVLVLHAAAAAKDGAAVLLAGEGGSGKSTALVGLVERGWTSISEDLCAVELSKKTPTVWPGPPWVRIRSTEPGPEGASKVFESAEKAGWDLSSCQATEALPVARIVVLQRPGGESVSWSRLVPGAAIAWLATHAAWLGDPDEGGARLFPLVARASSAAEVVALRIPVGAKWVEDLAEALDAGLAAAT
jgi:hypothetical protein